MKDFNTGNYKTLLKEIKQDTNRWKDTPWSWIGRLTTVKMYIIASAIPIKIPMAFSAEIEKILTFICNIKGPPIAKTIFKNQNKVIGLNLPDFKIHYSNCN